MGSGERYDAIVALGREIVKELEASAPADTLARWMAHDISQLIKDAELASGANRRRRRAECADAILRLWSHRRELPNGSRPLDDFGPLFRTLESLDPGSEAPRYFVEIRGALGDAEDVPDTAKDLLQVVSGIDHTARILIRHCIYSALDEIKDRGEQWLSLAKAADLGDADDLRILEIVFRRSGEMEPDLHDLEQQRLRDLLKRLNAFANVADTLAAHLQRQIDMPPGGVSSDRDGGGKSSTGVT